MWQRKDTIEYIVNMMNIQKTYQRTNCLRKPLSFRKLLLIEWTKTMILFQGFGK